MNRNELILAVLASSGGKPLTAIQMQRAVFLVTQNMPCLVDDTCGFNFTPCDYGVLDPQVYAEAEALEDAGEASITPPAIGRWATYAASDAGLTRGSRILAELDNSASRLLRDLSTEASSQAGKKFKFRRICCCGEC